MQAEPQRSMILSCPLSEYNLEVTLLRPSIDLVIDEGLKGSFSEVILVSVP